MPIESAPWNQPALVWDGSELFLAVRYNEYSDGEPRDELETIGWHRCEPDGSYWGKELIELTHWMPLPEPPEASE